MTLRFVTETHTHTHTITGTVLETNDETYAVIAPNMGKPIVVFQAMIDSAAKAFPNALKGYKLDVVESHQTGKADTSGTAKAVVESMGGLGLNGSTEKIQMIREPEQQVAEMGVRIVLFFRKSFVTENMIDRNDSQFQ